MVAYFQNIFLSNATKLNIIYALALGWIGFFAWSIAWPLTWVSIPVLLCSGYALYRLVFELTYNRSQHSPTIATCFVARRKTAKILERESALCNSEPYNVVDLGSGRGELARCIAKKIPTATVTGVELARFPYLQSVLFQRLFGPKNLSFKRSDFWSFDCSDMNAVVLYLGPITTQRIGEKLYQELRSGSIVISQTYPLLGKWVPIEILAFHAPFKEVIYIYKGPIK